MASDPQSATAEELYGALHWLQWCGGKKPHDTARALLDDLGCDWPPQRIINLCGACQRGVTVGTGLPIRWCKVVAVCRQLPNEHLHPGDWARMKDANGKATFDPLYLSSKEHMVRLASYWLCGANVPVDVADYFYWAHLSSKMRTIVTMSKLALLVHSPVLVMQG